MRCRVPGHHDARACLSAAAAPALEQLPWRDVPLLDTPREHGRDEIRRVKTATITRGLDFPRAVRAVQIVRRRRTVTTRKSTLQREHAVTPTGRGSRPVLREPSETH
jgi:hypothetical protein